MKAGALLQLRSRSSWIIKRAGIGASAVQGKAPHCESSAERILLGPPTRWFSVGRIGDVPVGANDDSRRTVC